MGTGDDIGIIPKLNNTLFEQVDTRSSDETKFLVTVSYLEIYNEMIQDLLNPTERELKIREHPDLGIYVEGLCEMVVKSETEVLKLIEQGNTVRCKFDCYDWCRHCCNSTNSSINNGHMRRLFCKYNKLCHC